MDKKYDEQCIKRYVQNSIDMLYERDSFLLENDTNERSITHKLAGYLENYFPEWDVDCEYNRNRGEVKRIPPEPVASDPEPVASDPEPVASDPEPVASDDTKAVTVFPDIIVHKRNTGENLLVIEVKKASNNKDDAKLKDLKKLRQFKQDPYNYLFAIFLVLDEKTNEKPIRFIEKEEIIN
jgi:hypothetical protein